MQKIKLAIADDQKLFLKGLKFIIQTFENVEIVAEANDGQELLDKIELAHPDVVLSDIKMPGMDGIEATKIIKSRYPEIKVILLTMYDDERLISHVMEIGANGYLLKDEDSEVVQEAIHSVMEKGFYFNDYVSRALLKQVKSKNKLSPTEILSNSPQMNLSPRELEVLQLICQEMSTNEIAEKLFISARTVEGHRKKLLEKTEVKNVAGLVIYAVKNKLVDLEE
ncbi:MAG: response regulator transcription factor [Bacteroidota bacterium]